MKFTISFWKICFEGLFAEPNVHRSRDGIREEMRSYFDGVRDSGVVVSTEYCRDYPKGEGAEFRGGSKLVEQKPEDNRIRQPSIGHLQYYPLDNRLRGG